MEPDFWFAVLIGPENNRATYLTVKGRSFSKAFDGSTAHRNRSPGQLETESNEQ